VGKKLGKVERGLKWKTSPGGPQRENRRAAENDRKCIKKLLLGITALLFLRVFRRPILLLLLFYYYYYYYYYYY